MTEQDLIDLGFEKFTETPENGGYHYYTLGELISNANDEAGEDGWYVTLYGEIHDYKFTDVTEVKQLVTLLDKNIIAYDKSTFDEDDLPF